MTLQAAIQSYLSGAHPSCLLGHDNWSDTPEGNAECMAAYISACAAIGRSDALLVVLKAVNWAELDSKIGATIAAGGPASVDEAENLLLCADSECRLEFALRLVNAAPAASLGWPILIFAWPICDDTWSLRGDLLRVLRRLHERAHAREFMAESDAALYDSLPDRVTVYRGCSRPRVRGVAWTLDRDIAAGFAQGHRSIAVPDPVIATASIPKEAIYFVQTDRLESEVVLDPRRLANLSAPDFTRSNA